MMTGRGTDIRLERNDRVGAAERKERKRRNTAGRNVSDAAGRTVSDARGANRERSATRSALGVVVKIGTTALTTQRAVRRHPAGNTSPTPSKPG